MIKRRLSVLMLIAVCIISLTSCSMPASQPSPSGTSPGGVHSGSFFDNLKDSKNENVYLSIFQATDRIVITGYKNVCYSIENEHIPGYDKIDYSLSGDRAVINTEEGNLYLLTPEEYTLIAKSDCRGDISNNGDAVLYCVKNSAGKYDLMKYMVDTKQSTLISDQVSGFGQDYCACISPSGNSVAFYYYNNPNHFVSYYKKGNGELQSIGEDIIPMAISDDANTIFIGRSNTISVIKNGVANELYKLENNAIGMRTMFLFNRDFSEMAILAINEDNSEMKSVIYTEKKGIEPFIAMSSDYSSGIAPVLDGNIPVKRKLILFAIEAIIDAEGLQNLILTDGAKIASPHYTSKVFSHGSSFPVEPYRNDEGYIFVNESGDLMKTSAEDDNVNSVLAEGIRGEICDLQATSDGSNIYYITNGGALYFIENNSDPVLVDNTVTGQSGRSSSCFSPDETKLYFEMNDDKSSNGKIISLYSTINGKKPVKVADNTHRFWATTSQVFYSTEYNDESKTSSVYFSDGSSQFSLLAEGVLHCYFPPCKANAYMIEYYQ